MFKRASMAIVLTGILSAASMVGAEGPADLSGAPANRLPQANLSPDAGLVSLDFQDADIRNVLKVLAFKSGVNIVAAPDVTGVISIELKDVPWQKALEVILSTYGYGFDRKGNIITVMTVESLKKYREDSVSLESQEPLVSKTFLLNYAKAEDVLKIIDKMISKRGFINFDARTNSIILRDLTSDIELISGVIQSIDTITPQVMIETKIIETDLNNSENIGVDWTNGLTLSLTGANRPTTFPFTSSKGILGFQGPGSFIPQSTSFSSASAFVPSSSSSSSSSTPITTTSTGSTLSYGTIDASQLTATLQFLSTRSTTKILSNPRIVTLDNQTAKINIGLQYPVPNYSFNSATGQEQVTGFTPLPIGVNFEVTPHVNNAGLITLHLHPQISALQATITVQSNPFPETSNEEAETNVMVEDGRTLVIGGLITQQTVVTTTKIPILGDIPFLGYLFKNTNSNPQKKEVIIFLTPHIITVGKDSASHAIQ